MKAKVPMSSDPKSRQNSAKLVTNRGYLPHFHHPDAIQHVTFRLADSVPVAVIERWRRELESESDVVSHADSFAARLQERIERYADAGYGACWLSRPDIAVLVVEVLCHFDGARYGLLEWCVMPNHVHVLLRADRGHSVSDIVRGWKALSARRANVVLARKGTFWSVDYFDRFIRDSDHLQACRTYIKHNPVAAGLVAVAGDWPWSSR